LEEKGARIIRPAGQITGERPEEKDSSGCCAKGGVEVGDLGKSSLLRVGGLT